MSDNDMNTPPTPAIHPSLYNREEGLRISYDYCIKSIELFLADANTRQVAAWGLMAARMGKADLIDLKYNRERARLAESSVDVAIAAIDAHAIDASRPMSLAEILQTPGCKLLDKWLAVNCDYCLEYALEQRIGPVDEVKADLGYKSVRLD